MTVRELLRAHDLKTQDEADELLVKLAQDRDALLKELKHLARLLEPALNNGQANVPGLATLNKTWQVIAQAERSR